MLTAIAVIIIGVKFNLIHVEVLGIISVVFSCNQHDCQYYQKNIEERY